MGEKILNDDNHIGGWFSQDGMGGIFGVPGSTAGGGDFAGFSWKDIEAAICGGSAISTPAQLEHAKTIADPQTLYDAADALLFVQNTLQMVATAIDDQSRALADGDNPAWKGAGATAFLAKMDMYKRQVQANVDVLSGGKAGRDSVPNQLAQNAYNLADAQNKIHAIDSWYAGQVASVYGASYVNDGQLTVVSTHPDIVNMMTADMLPVLQQLAGKYQVTVDSITPPQPVTPPLTQQPPPNIPQPPPLTVPPPPPPPTTTPPPTLGGPPPTAPPLTTPPPTTVSNPPPLSSFPGNKNLSNAPNLGGGPNTGPGSLNPGTISPFPQLNKNLANGGGLNGGGNNTISPPKMTPFPGSTNLGNGPNGNMDSQLNPNEIQPFPGANNGLGNNGLGNNGLGNVPMPMPIAAPPTGNLNDGPGLGTGNQVKPPGLGGTGGTGGISGFPKGNSGLGNGPGLGNVTPKLPGTGNLETNAPPVQKFPGFDENGLANGSGLQDKQNQGAGMPMMPMMPGGGGAGGSQNGGEVSDASGLLKPQAFPGTGDLSNGTPIDGLNDGGAVKYPPGFGPGAINAFPGTQQDGQQVGGMPGMPMMPGMGGMGGGKDGGAGERSDASGLLSPSVKPWTGDPSLSDELGRTGALPGGLGLTGLPGLDAPEVSPNGLGGPAGMPMMPGMGGAGGQKSTGGERSDASGLLTPQEFPGVPIGSDGLPVGEVTGGVAPGMPMMPGMGGAGGQKSTGGERSDASGLLTPQEFPGAPVGSDGLPVGEVTGGVAPGMPMMPMMPGAAGAGQPTTGGERSDASGLLTPQQFPGAPVSSDGLPVGGVTDNAGAAPGMPMMPGVPVLPGAAGHQRDEHPGKSELVRPQEFAGAPVGADGVPVTGVRAEDGAAPGAVDRAGAAVPVAPAGDRVAMVPDSGEVDETAAWEVAGASFVPLLFPVAGGRRRDEREVVIDAVSTEAEETWTGAAADGPRATWRPDRTPGARSAQLGEPPRLMCGSGTGPPPPEPEPVPDEQAGDGNRDAGKDKDTDVKTVPPTVVSHLLTQEAALWGGAERGVLD